MGNWGDDQDIEAQKLEDYKGRFTINFKKIYYDVDEISQRTLEVTDKHPKDSLLLLLAGTLVGMFLFMLIAYKIFVILSLPFLAFYFIALLRVFKCWKAYRYNALQFWLLAIVGIIAAFALSRGVQYLFFTFVMN